MSDVPKAPPKLPASLKEMSDLSYEEQLNISGVRPLWTVRKLADTLGVSTDFIYTAVNRKEIPCVRFGTSIRFHHRDVAVWINQQRQLPSKGH